MVMIAEVGAPLLLRCEYVVMAEMVRAPPAHGDGAGELCRSRRPRRRGLSRRVVSLPLAALPLSALPVAALGIAPSALLLGGSGSLLATFISFLLIRQLSCGLEVTERWRSGPATPLISSFSAATMQAKANLT